MCNPFWPHVYLKKVESPSSTSHRRPSHKIELYCDGLNFFNLGMGVVFFFPSPWAQVLDLHFSKMLQVLSYMELNNRGRECSVGRRSGKIWPRSYPAKQMALKVAKYSMPAKQSLLITLFSSIRFLWAIPAPLPYPLLLLFFFSPQIFFSVTDALTWDQAQF